MQSGLIILDGPDAMGKTTLQEYFVDHHDAVPVHLTYPAPKEYRDMLDYQAQHMFWAIESSANHLVIVDRHWLSEVIYAKVFRGGSPWPYMGKMMDAVWRANAAIYIICLPNNIQDAVQRHKENLDSSHPYTDEKYYELLYEYMKFYQDVKPTRPDILPYRIEIEGLNMDSYCKIALAKLVSRQKEVAKWR